MKTAALLLCTLLLFPLLVGSVHAQEAIIGSIKNVEGSAFILRGDEKISAAKGGKLHQGDALVTEGDGIMGVILRDDTLISLGPNTQIAIDEFRFVPAQNELSILTRMVKGVVTYISGQIAKISPESARFETPVATIGVRGTKFLVKIEDT